MAKPVTMDSYNPIEWIDEPTGLDPSFIDEVPLVPDKTLQAIIEPMIRSEVEELFGLTPPLPWALFFPFKDFSLKIKRLFKRQILESIDVEDTIDLLDNLHENGTASDSDDGEKLYSMLYELNTLNELLEEIILKILSSLKP